MGSLMINILAISVLISKHVITKDVIREKVHSKVKVHTSFVFCTPPKMKIVEKIVICIIKQVIKVKETTAVTTTRMEIERLVVIMVEVVVGTVMMAMVRLMLVEGIIKVFEEIIKVEVGFELLILLSLLTFIAIQIILLPLFLVGQNLISFCYLHKFFLCIRIFVLVRMILQCKISEGLLDVLL